MDNKQEYLKITYSKVAGKIDAERSYVVHSHSDRVLRAMCLDFLANNVWQKTVLFKVEGMGESFKVKYSRVIDCFEPRYDTIRAITGNQGETQICSNSEKKLELTYLNFLGSNKKHQEVIFAVDRSLKFRRCSASKTLVATTRTQQEHSASVKAKSVVTGERKTTPSELSALDKKSVKSALFQGIVAASLLVPLILIGAPRNNHNASTFQSFFDSPSKIKSVTPDLNSYVKNNALTTYLNSDIKPQTLALSPNGEILVLGEKNRLILERTRSYSYRKIVNFKDYEKGESIAIANNGLMAIGLTTGLVKILNSQGVLILEIDSQYTISALAFSHSSQNLILGNNAGVVQVFDLNSGNELMKLRGHSAKINAILASTNQIITASNDTTVRVWNQTGEVVSLLQDTSEVFSLAKDLSGNIYSGNQDGTIRKWSPTGKQLDVYRWQNQKISTLAIANNILVSGSNDGSVWVFNLSERLSKKVLPYFKGYVNKVAISPDGETIFGLERNQITVLSSH
ncbi:MAG: WD40 repeat domain-containing protein [Prochloraceae cyanobacterium]|nr:WD40 repeat domain-containing protein [Prochloraceae cyanobacterium]